MSKVASISIVIPTYNEEAHIGRLGRFLSPYLLSDRRLIEVVVVDAMSTDKTPDIVSSFGFKLIQSSYKSRAIQLNEGAKTSSGDVLYFIHADVVPPSSFLDDIFDAIETGSEFGCFSYQFDTVKKLLSFNARFTRRDSSFIGGGDQTLFMKRSVFDKLDGFREDHIIMEDYELYWRAKKEFRHSIIPHDAIVSARKYEKNSYLRVQLANLLVFASYRLGLGKGDW